MGDSRKDIGTGAGHAELVAELSSLRELLAERDEWIAEQDERIAELTGLIRDLRDEIRELKKMPKRPKPDRAAREGGGERKPASDRPKGEGKGRGPRRRNPDLHRREVKVALGDVPEGAERRG